MYDFVEMGKTIRNHREEHGLTIEQLAELCGLSYRCISNIERGLANPKFSTIVIIYFVLDENLNELKNYIDKHNDWFNHTYKLVSKLLYRQS